MQTILDILDIPTCDFNSLIPSDQKLLTSLVKRYGKLQIQTLQQKQYARHTTFELFSDLMPYEFKNDNGPIRHTGKETLLDTLHTYCELLRSYATKDDCIHLHKNTHVVYLYDKEWVRDNFVRFSISDFSFSSFNDEDELTVFYDKYRFYLKEFTHRAIHEKTTES